VVATVPDAPGVRVPTEDFETCEVVPLAVREIVTVTE
jgi:hypothetical protein